MNMELSVKFCEIEAGTCPVRESPDELKVSDLANSATMRPTNFDRYLEEQLRDPAFARRFRQAGQAWDVALQIAALRERAGLSQRELARRVKTTQQQISRLESPRYEGHSLSMLRRVARQLGARVRVVIEAEEAAAPTRVAEAPPSYRSRRARTTRA